jgi:hypothetical protein
MLLEEHGFSLAIAHLLLQIGLDGLAPVVPHDGRWTEADAMAAFLQTPANVDIITRRRVGRIKAADLSQRIFAERHITAWDVFGGVIVEQNMRR